MKNIFLMLSLALVVASCKKNETELAIVEEPTVAYAVFGDSIVAAEALSNEEMAAMYASLKEGDTINVKFKSAINEVCQKKGCWMTLDLAEEKQAFVKFKDYGFFVPMNAQEKEVIVSGKAYVGIESVDELKHYAKDAGKSQAAIDSIIAPKVTYSFMADGVLIAK
jgi:hypothetical protein